MKKLMPSLSKRVQLNMMVASLLLAMSTPLMAEDYGPHDYSIVPPAPQVQALMDFKEYPVNYFNGIPQINFTLYTLKVGQISVPITLSYHGGGIRVEQNAGNAGLGWTVSCGATISHTVYGAPDDANCGTNKINGLFHLSKDEKQFRQKLIEKKADYDPTSGYNFMENLSWETTLGNNYYLGRTDVANDLYNLYGQGLSATFVILPDEQSDKQVHCVSETPVKIKKNSLLAEPSPQIGCDNWGFTVESNDGLTYNFKSQDRTKYNYTHGSPELQQYEDSLYYASSWHLNNIVDLSGNKVTFTYNENAPRVIKISRHAIARGYSNPEYAATSASNSNGVNSSTYYPKVLTKLEGNGITVEFDYLFQNSGYRDAMLKSITVKSPDGETRKFTFSYGTENTLMAVTDVSDPINPEQIYKFDYYYDYVATPYYDEQDFGGYWNGIDNGYHLIPYKLFSSGQVGWGADRSVRSDYATQRSLKRITYATGGYTEFEWESNSFSHCKNMEYDGRLNSSQTLRVETDTMRIVIREPEFTKLKINNWYIEQGQTAELDLTQYLAMNPTKYYNTAYSHDNSAKYPVYPERNTPDYPHVVIRKSATKELVQVIYIDGPTIEPDGVKTATKLTLDPGRYDFELVKPLAMDGADYDFENEFFYHDCNAGKIYLNRITTDGDRSPGHENWCGLRIRRITSNAGEDENDELTKYYYYNLGCSPTETSGTIQVLPQYDYKYYESRSRIGIQGYEGSEVYCMGESAFPQSTTGSMSNLEYPRVSVKMGLDEPENSPAYLNTLREAYVYSSARDLKNVDYNHTDFLEFQPIGARMYTSLAHRRGNLEKKINYYAYAPAHTTEYYYNIYEKDDLPILTTDAFTISDFTKAPGSSNNGGRDYGIGRYTLIPYNKTIGSEIVSEKDGLYSYKQYDYFYTKYTDSLDWNLVKSISTIDSEQRKVATNYTYVVGRNSFLPLPETEVTTCDGTVTSASRTQYDAVTKLPLAKYMLSGTAEAQELLSTNQETTWNQKRRINDLTFQYRYNSQGNLIQISYKGKPLASYIWGYNGMYPIIEATDVDYETLVSAAKQCGLTETQINGSSVTTDSQVTSSSKQLRTKLPDSNITSISYHWLLGVAKITSPRGDSSTYDYDHRGRLVKISDFNGYLISKYEYQYANATDEDFDY